MDVDTAGLWNRFVDFRGFKRVVEPHVHLVDEDYPLEKCVVVPENCCIWFALASLRSGSRRQEIHVDTAGLWISFVVFREFQSLMCQW